jgi:hypothetical protein
VNQFVVNSTGTGFAYSGSVIYNASGVQVAAPALPQLNGFQTVSTDAIYDPVSNAIYSLTTGQPVWQGTFPGAKVGGVGGTYAVYESGHKVVVESDGNP